MAYKIRKIDVAIIIAVIVVVIGVYGIDQPCTSDLDTSACDALVNSANQLKCYKNLSYYENDECICKNLEEPDEQECYISFAARTKRVDICGFSSLTSFESGEGLSGSDICYYTVVFDNANFFSRRWTKDNIIKICRKISDKDLKETCLSYQRFAINESAVED